MDYRELVNLGLSEKESKVYLSSLELGKSVVQDIAKKSGVNRATTYVVIDSLIKKGLLSSYMEGKKQFFCAESPEKLSLLFREQAMTIQRKQEDLEKILPKLKILNNTNKDKPVVRFFEGKNGISAMVDELLDVAKKDSIVQMVYSVDSVNNFSTEEERENWRKRRIDKNIKAKAIYTYKKGQLSKRLKSSMRKVPINKFPIKSDIAVYGNFLRLASLKDRRIGIIIEDKEIADTIRAIFDLAWEGASKYQK